MLPEVIAVRVVDERRMPVELDRQIRRVLCVCFPKDEGVFSKTRAWHGCAPAWSVVLEDAAGAILAHVGIVDRTVSVGRQSFRVGGVQNVLVMPEVRGQGLSDRVMTAAQAVMCCQGLDAGLLFCIPKLVGVYARTGWVTMSGLEVVRIDETGSEVPLPEGNVAMWLPIRHAGVPEGRLHLNGNDW